MKHVIAIVLLCLPTQLAAAERCNKPRVAHAEIVRLASAKPLVRRVEIARPQKVRAPAAWQKLLLEQQIL
jgi:hypothetical protein